ncbi:MAG TPA: S24 family peptidase [Hymenobacter sp.]
MKNVIILGEARTDAGLLPFINTLLSCGFSSPAADYESELVDLNQLMLRHSDASFLARAHGDSMTGAGIHDGDVLAVDQSMQAQDGDIAAACMEGEYTMKGLRKRLDWLACGEAEPKAPVAATNVEQAANEAVQHWCQKIKADLSTVGKQSAVYLLPKRAKTTSQKQLFAAVQQYLRTASDTLG